MSVAPCAFGGPPPPRVRSPRHRPRIIVSIVALTLCWSCSGGATDVPEVTPGRAEFIGAYTDLRTAALSSGSTELGDEVRDSILAIYDVTAQDLMDFIETHGEDVEFMRDLWTEIEALMTERLEENARDEENEGTDGTDGTDAADRIEGGDAGV